jgi:hypothetical protein
MLNSRSYLVSTITAHLASDQADLCIDYWPFYRMKNGYGQSCYQGHHILAHRLAYVLFIGDPGDLEVLHDCDNPPCFNPRHLFKGTQGDNMADMRSKRRAANMGALGVRNCNHRLTPDDIRAIRSLYKPCKAGASGAKETSLPTLAKQFGVSVQTIWNVVKRRTWAHIDPNMCP